MASDSNSREYPTSPRVAVAALIAKQPWSLPLSEIEPPEVVLVQRGRPPAVGTWAPPGGRMELGETVINAVKREILEETGMKIVVQSVAGVVDGIHFDEQGRVLYHYVIIEYFAYMAPDSISIPSHGDDAADARLIFCK